MVVNKASADTQHLWPIKKYDSSDEPHFLFIVTPPYSGSTAISQLLNSSRRSMLLQERGEGQWLIPGLCERGRWNQDRIVNYESIKSVWLEKYQSATRGLRNIDVVIEKSPPNMIRLKELALQFKSVSFLANNRNPYANCSSILYRQHDAENLFEKKRLAILKSLAQEWVNRSLMIKKLIETMSIPLVTYEDFCSNPEIIKELLKTPEGFSETIKFEVKVKVKDYESQKIVNQNPRQINNLSPKEIDMLNQYFLINTELLSFFGYEIF